MFKNLQNIFIEELNDIKNEYPNIIKEVRGIGLLIGYSSMRIKINLLKN